MTPQEITEVLDQYDDLPLECDGFTRVAHYVLERHNVPHKIQVGYAEFAGRTISPHFWIEVDSGWVIDYRLRMWLGEDAPHGVFQPEVEQVTYMGRETSLYVPDVIFQVLTSKS
jgi:hypothetical protein